MQYILSINLLLIRVDRVMFILMSFIELFDIFEALFQEDYSLPLNPLWNFGPMLMLIRPGALLLVAPLQVGVYFLAIRLSHGNVRNNTPFLSLPLKQSIEQCPHHVVRSPGFGVLCENSVSLFSLRHYSLEIISVLSASHPIRYFMSVRSTLK